MRGEVAPGDVIATLHTLLTMFVIECDVEVDGATVSEQDKRRIVASPARLSSPRTPMSADDLSDVAETYRSLADVMRYSFRQLADAEFDNLKKVQGVTAELANEALRQRTLLHNSLKDCDAVTDRLLHATFHAHLRPRPGRGVFAEECDRRSPGSSGDHTRDDTAPGSAGEESANHVVAAGRT